jgi:GTP cyclohydrolase IB
MLEDVQDRFDGRQLPIDEVGITGIRYPVAVFDHDSGKQDTVAEVTMSVDLRPDVKGAHLSRFVEVLHDCAGEITPDSIPVILRALRDRLGSRRASVAISFPYFLRRPAPISGSAAYMDYQCRVMGLLEDASSQLLLGVRVPVTSVCPCSKAISDYGAHNQRSHITIEACPRNEGGSDALVWLEDLIDIAEASASSPVYPILKRPDERHVTMQAHDNPVFVEDMAREVARVLTADDRITWFSVEAASDESIHNHGAFARIQSQTLGDPFTAAHSGGG